MATPWWYTVSMSEYEADVLFESPDEPAETASLLNEAIEAVQQSDEASLERVVSRLLRDARPNDGFQEARSWATLALAYMKTDPVLVRGWAFESLTSGPPRTEAFVLLGDQAFRQGDRSSALCWYDIACKIDLEPRQVNWLGKLRKSRRAQALRSLGKLPPLLKPVSVSSPRRKLDVVSPVKALDAERARIMVMSARKFLEPMGRIYIVTSDEDHETVKRAVDGIDDRVVFLKHGFFVEHPDFQHIHGWYKQQFIKLAAAESVVDSDFYLVLDADTFFVRPTRFEDLVRDGRGAFSYSDNVVEARYFDKWYKPSAALFGEMKLPERPVNMTGFAVLSTVLVESALSTLEDIHKTSWVDLLLESVPPMKNIVEADGARRMIYQAFDSWTEFTLYHAYGRLTEAWKDFHVEVRDLHGNSLVEPETWDPRKSFESSHHFTTVQSLTGVPASFVWDKVKSFLETP